MALKLTGVPGILTSPCLWRAVSSKMANHRQNHPHALSLTCIPGVIKCHTRAWQVYRSHAIVLGILPWKRPPD
ncbi:hypothetical protein PENSPDRAFT_351738 [Peniophora sp. CONT]|nr:hypothetical protein PENSPDRAFT_351738 [Peniophora sp. CONT]